VTEILTALISLVGAALGTFGGIWAGAKLTEYRLAQLEKKVDAHNQFALLYGHLFAHTVCFVSCGAIFCVKVSNS
jgi:hypothetical protein